MDNLSTKIKEHLNKIRELNNDIDKIQKDIDNQKGCIKKYAHELIDQLVTIDGWESLINYWCFRFKDIYKDCKTNNDKMTCIKDCYLQWTDDNIIQFKAPFTGSDIIDDETVLEIDLNMSLKEQIDNKLKN